MAHPTFFERIFLHISRYYVSACFTLLRALTLPFCYLIEFVCAKLKVANSPELHEKKLSMSRIR